MTNCILNEICKHGRVLGDKTYSMSKLTLPGLENYEIKIEKIRRERLDAKDSERKSISNEYNNSAKGMHRIKQKCFGAKEGYFDGLNELCNKRDEISIKQGIEYGIFTVLQPGECTIVKSSFGKKKVKVGDEEWWVSQEFID